MRETYFTNYEQGFLETDFAIQDLEANVFRRYKNSLEYVVPWLANNINLHEKTVIEIGCETGSSTAAFAHFVKSNHGYDIDHYSVEGAKND